ncbi:hemolysin family protein [Dellaglioa algida]|uniref:hemolysin family protein n=1 Tax=Dellaglioa algida TaxID=105612 RepID=UPI0024DEE1E1|nr:hemolysin family protein [Dellaglioa algida]MDK1740915.1 hemolysin family protein [Dellaglioa algida]
MDSGPESYLLNIIVIIAILLLSVLFTLTEYALVRVRVSALKDMQEKKPFNKNVKRAIHMTENLTEYLSTAQVGITSTSLILGWIGEKTIADAIIQSHILPAAMANAVASVAAILIFTVIHAVFTDLVPKNIAIADPLPVLLFIVRPILFFHIVLYPLIWILDRSANWITHLLGYEVENEEDIYSQTEILSLSRLSANAGELDEEDLTFMRRAFDMNDKVAVDIMIDRTSMVAVDIDATIKNVVNLYWKRRYSRFPVIANNDKDKVIGYVYSYDLLRQERINKTSLISTIMRDIPAVQENAEVHGIMDVMVSRRTPIVIVVNEYGGTSGIITDKDIYEELFGVVREEFDDTNDDNIVDMGNNIYKVSGKVTLYDFERYFDTTLKETEESEAVTLTGLVLNKDSKFRANDEMTIANFKIKALDYENAYISEFEVTVLPVSEKTHHNELSEQN